MTTYPQSEITGIVLAGGEGRRMGGVDKGLTPLAGLPMAAHVVAALRAQCGEVLINANRNAQSYADLGCQVFADAPDAGADMIFNGPLAGIHAALAHARTQWVLIAPCDSPLVASTLGERLWAPLSRTGAEIAVAHDGERLHPVFALLRTNLADSAADFLRRGQRKIDRWYAEHDTIEVQLADLADTFLNVNRIEDQAALEARLKQA